MKFRGVLLASDYDGTLYDENGLITTQVREAIAYFIANGGRFTVCTGRTLHGFHAYDPSYINAPVLLANGAMSYDYEAGQIISKRLLGEEIIRPLRALTKRFETASVELFALDNNFCIHTAEVSRNHITSQGMTYTEITDPAMAEYPLSKLMIFSEHESPAIQNWLEFFEPQVNFLRTKGRYIEIMAQRVNKGTGLMSLAEKLGIRKEHVYAVGDGFNDVDMLRAAKLGFAPENSSPEAKAAADVIVKPNTQGAVADVIDKLDNIY